MSQASASQHQARHLRTPPAPHIEALARDGQWEPYDMVADRTNRHDLAAQHPNFVKKMSAQWNMWVAASFVDPWPGGQRLDWGAPANRNEKNEN